MDDLKKISDRLAAAHSKLSESVDAVDRANAKHREAWREYQDASRVWSNYLNKPALERAVSLGELTMRDCIDPPRDDTF